MDRKGSHLLPYSAALFNFLDVSKNPAVPLVFNPSLPSNLGYAGFYVRYPDMGIGSDAELARWFFHCDGRQLFSRVGEGAGLRAFLARLGDQPRHLQAAGRISLFTDWWLREPAPGATELTLDALLDSPSVAGAYEFRIRPGAVTSVDIHASLYFRQATDNVGLCPFSSMYLFGENAKGPLQRQRSSGNT